MISIDNSSLQGVLSDNQRNNADVALEVMQEYYDANKDNCILGVSKIEIKKKHYRYGNIRSALLSSQNSKCAYCETVCGAKGENDIEHFRPKGSYRQRLKKKEHRPGYYWLAYDVQNLLISCQPCNRAKDNYFPLLLHSSRCRDHYGDINKEHPLIINPAQEDPKNHISFEGEVARWRTKEGKITIKYLKLNRITLLDERKTVYDSLKFLKLSISKLSSKDQIKAGMNLSYRIADASSGACAYSKMILDNFT